MTGRRVLIAAGNPQGHRLMYVRILIRAALDAGSAVTLLVGFSADNEYFDLHLAAVRHEVDIVERGTVDLPTLRKVCAERLPDHVVVPDGDTVALQLARSSRWRESPSLTILVMRDPAADVPGSVPRRVKLTIKRALLYRVSHMATVTVLRLRAALPGLRQEPGYVGDPVLMGHTPESVARLRRGWGLSEDVFWFGVVGAITERKNLPLTAEALAPLGGFNVGLLIAGRCTDAADSSAADAMAAARMAGVRIERSDRLLSDEEIDSAVAAVDCVVLLHSNEGPSGILGKAAAAGTRVVAGGAMSLRSDVTALGSGQWVPLIVDEVTNAFKHAQQSIRPRPVVGLDAAEFAERLL